MVGKDNANQLKALHLLHLFVQSQLHYFGEYSLEKKTIKNKGVSDKKHLFSELDQQIKQAFMENNTEELESLIYQTATIAHHRRHRTLNKSVGFFTAGFIIKNANSWKSFTNFIDQNFSKFDDNIAQLFQNSQRVKEDKIHCKVKMSPDEIVDVQGYEAYRQAYRLK